MEQGTVLILAIVGSFTIVVTSAVIVMGLYLLQARHDQEINFRESLRSQRAIAIAQAEAGNGGGEGDGLMGLIAQVAPLLEQYAKSRQQVQSPPQLEGVANGEKIQ